MLIPVQGGFLTTAYFALETSKSVAISDITARDMILPKQPKSAEWSTAVLIAQDKTGFLKTILK